MKRLHLLGIFLALASFLPFYSSAKEMTLQNKVGQELDCHFISLEGEVVRVRRVSDDREFDLKLDQLSKSSVRLVMEQAAGEEEVPVSGEPVWLTEKLKVDVELKKGRTKALDKKENFDNRIERLQPGILLRNNDYHTTVGPQRGILIHYGESTVDTSEYRVLAREEFTFTVEPRDSYSFEGKVYKNMYDKWNTARFGHPYDGAVFVALDNKNKVTYVKSSMSKFRNDPALVLKMKVGQTFGRR